MEDEMMANYPTIPKTSKPDHWLHRFDPDLLCTACGVSWSAHQQQPTPCPYVDGEKGEAK